MSRMPVKSVAKKSKVKKSKVKKPAMKKKNVAAHAKSPKEQKATPMKTAAHAARIDDLYAQIADIERELSNYRARANSQVSHCNCADSRVGGFAHYFPYNYERFSCPIYC